MLEDMTKYQFNKKVVSLYFCPTCGTGMFGLVGNSGSESYAVVNVRTVQGVDVEKLELYKLDGKHREVV